MKTKKTPKVKKVKSESKPESKGAYTASIKVLGKVYTAKGSTVSEALAKLTPDGTPRGMSILSVSNGDMKRDKVLGGVATYRLFSPSKLVREIALKNVSAIFSM